MSPDGQHSLRAPPPGVAVDLGPSDGFERHAHPVHQLAVAGRGVLVMGASGRTWVLPPSLALWIPAGVAHSVAVSGPTTMLSIYVEPDRCPLTWVEPTVVASTGLAGALAAHLAQADLSPGERARAEAVLWDVLVARPIVTLAPPTPTDERARAVAEGLLADVTDERTLAEWGRSVGASPRTLARLFASETGVGFERWRTTARLAAALPLLANGMSVGATSRRVGYATPSAFVAAFRRVVGSTPAEYVRPGGER